MSVDPRLKDVARNMVVSLDVLTGSPKSGREIAAVYAMGTDLGWWDLRDAFVGLLDETHLGVEAADGFWVNDLSSVERGALMEHAGVFNALVLSKERTRDFFRDTADFTLLAPDVLRQGNVYDLVSLPAAVLHRVCDATAAAMTGHLTGYGTLDVPAMHEGVRSALETVLTQASGYGTFTVGSLSYRPDYSTDDDPMFVIPVSKDAGGYRVFFQLRVGKSGGVSWSVWIYQRKDRNTSPFDLVIATTGLTTERAAELFAATKDEQVLDFVQEHTKVSLPAEEASPEDEREEVIDMGGSEE